MIDVSDQVPVSALDKIQIWPRQEAYFFSTLVPGSGPEDNGPKERHTQAS